MKKIVASIASSPFGQIFSEAASLPSGVSAAAPGVTLVKSFFMNHTAARRLGAGRKSFRVHGS